MVLRLAEKLNTMTYGVLKTQSLFGSVISANALGIGAFIDFLNVRSMFLRLAEKLNTVTYGVLKTQSLFGSVISANAVSRIHSAEVSNC